MKLVFLFCLFLIMIESIKFILRKALKIPKVKRKVFSYNHINTAHRKVDWVVRIATLIINLVITYQLIYQKFSINLFLVLMVLLLTSENFVRAFFEWRYSDHPRESIITMAEAVIMIALVLFIAQFDVLQLLTK
jgi:hypothetical protein